MFLASAHSSGSPHTGNSEAEGMPMEFQRTIQVFTLLKGPLVWPMLTEFYVHRLTVGPRGVVSGRARAAPTPTGTTDCSSDWRQNFSWNMRIKIQIDIWAIVKYNES